MNPFIKHTIIFSCLQFCLASHAQDKLSLQVNIGHPGGVSFVQPSDDGQRIYSAGGGYFKTWDIQSRSVILNFKLGFFGEPKLLIDEKNARIYSYANNIIHILDLNSGNETGHIKDSVVTNDVPMAICPKTSLLVYGTQEDNSLVIYDTERDYVVRKIRNVLPKAPSSVAFSHDGKFLAIACSSMGGVTRIPGGFTNLNPTDAMPQVRVLSTSDWSVIKDVGSFKYPVYGLSFSKNDLYLMALGLDTIKVWNTHDFSPQSMYSPTPDMMARSASFSGNGDTILAGFDKYLTLIDTKSGHLLDTISYQYVVDQIKTSYGYLPQNVFSYLEFLPENNFVAAGYSLPDNNLGIWDLKARKFISLHANLIHTNLVKFSHDGRYFISAGSDNLIRVWDAKELRLVGVLKYHSSKILSASFSPDDMCLLSSGEDGKIVLWDLKSFALTRVYTEHTNWVLFVSFIKDSHSFVSAGRDNKLKLWDTGQEHSLSTLDSIFTDDPQHWDAWGAVLVHQNQIISGRIDGTLRFCHVANNRLLLDTTTGKLGTSIMDIALTPDNKFLLTAPLMEASKLFSMDSLKMTSIPKSSFLFPLTSTAANHIAVNDMTNTVLFASINTIVIFDLNNRSQQYFYDKDAIFQSDGLPESFCFHPVSGFLSAGTNNSIKLWKNDPNPTSLNLFVLPNSLDYVSVTGDNYYSTTKKGIGSLGFAYKNQDFLFEQFDYILDRPDLVLKEWPGGDTSQITLLKQAYTDYLGVLGISETGLKPQIDSIPSISLTFLKPTPATTAKEMQIRITGNLGTSPMDKLMVWSNNVPLFSRTGLNISMSQTNHLDTVLLVTLLPGTNFISASITDKTGRSSRIAQIQIESQSPYPPPSLFLVTIGVNHFDNIPSPLFYAEKDADDIEKLFTTGSQVYQHVESLKFRGSDGTADTFDTARFVQFIRKAGINDQVIIFVSSHGLLDDHKSPPQTFLALKKTNRDNLDRTALKIDLLESLLDQSLSRNKVVFIDACHAGKEPALIEQPGSGGFTVISPVEFAKDADDLLLPTQKAFAIMEATFMDVKRKGGVTIVSASGGLQIAQEHKDWQNGAFTKTLLEGVETRKADDNPADGIITLKELSDYIFRNISKLNVQQQPTFRSENLVNDFRLF